MVEACFMASATYPAGIFHQEQGFCRANKEFLPLIPSQSTRQEVLRAGCLKINQTHLEDQWKFTHFSKFSQSVILDSTVKQPVLVDVQDAQPNSVLFSSRIAEQYARHEKILQFLREESKSGRERSNFSVLTDIVGLHTVAVDTRQLVTYPSEDELSLYEIERKLHNHGQLSIIHLMSEFYVPSPLLDSLVDLEQSSMVRAHPDGQVLFTGTGIDMKDLTSIVSWLYPSNNSTRCSRKASLVPHFTRVDPVAQATVRGSSLKLQTPTVSPVKSPDKIKVKPSKRKKHSQKAVLERDLYRKSYFHACESLLSILSDRKRGKMTILSLKTSSPELPQLLTQFSAGIAGTGLAVIFSALCKIMGGGVPFCAMKLVNTGFGFGLVWLSWAINRLSNTIVHISKNSSRLGSNEDEIIRQVDRSFNEVFFRAATLVAVAMLRFA